MTSQENLGYNPTSSVATYSTSQYMTLAQASCPKPSPSPCMSNYGVRSNRDAMDWQKYMVKEKTDSTMALPGLISEEGYFPYNMSIRNVRGGLFNAGIAHARRPLGTQPLYPGF